MPVSVETQLRYRSYEKTMPTYIVSFVGDTEQQNFLYRKKNIIGQRLEMKFRNVDRKISVGAI